MQKHTLSIALIVMTSPIFAANAIDLYKDPLSSLAKFKIIDKPLNQTSLKTQKSGETNTLAVVRKTNWAKSTIIRYQQLYKGIPIVGAQVTVSNSNHKSLNANSNAEVNGHLVEDLQFNIKPALSEKEALDLAKTSYFTNYPKSATTSEKSQLEIRPDKNSEFLLTYRVSFKTVNADGKPQWPVFIINAQSGSIMKQWSNFKDYLDSGAGGNEKVRKYWYGKEGLPSLDVKKEGKNCVMESPDVRLVNLRSIWDWESKLLTPSQYPCNANPEENVNGAFSPTNDAYYFGHIIVDMYKNWYGINALQKEDGTPLQLIMRVHFGSGYDNAFWDGENKTMNFGDGEDLYPLVSLDIVGHEVTHGFTEQHSNLDYLNQSGAINESLSDMAGQAARAYLLETSPLLYNKSHLTANKVTWGIGETVMREQFSTAMRYMDQPSADGESADCFDRSVAKRFKSSCAITYAQVIYNANQIQDPHKRQSYIVHTASGVFNKAFFLISQKIGIKKAYEAMILANVKYMTNPASSFREGACSVFYAAKDLHIDLNMVRTAFGQVGIGPLSCNKP